MNKKQSKNKSPVSHKKIKKLKIEPQKKRAIKKRIRQNRPAHKRLFLHPVAVFLWLCVGVMIIGWTYKVIADNYTVTATLPAAPLSQGATIIYPASGQVFSSQSLIVQGSCQQDTYINLYDNSLFVGVAWCSSSSAFSISDDLFAGQNILSAEAFNITNEQGPATPDVSVTYIPPKSIPASTSDSNATATATLPIVLKGNFSFQTFVVGNSFSWTINLSGGSPPYNLTIDWGDGQQTTEIIKTDPTITLHHIYNKPGYYAVIVKSTDKNDDQASLQLAALIKNAGATNFTPSTNGPPPPPNSNNSPVSTLLSSKNNWLLLAWPSYIILALMMVSFWLGERREYSSLIRHKKPKRKHA